MPSGNPLLFQARVVLLEDLQSYILYIYIFKCIILEHGDFNIYRYVTHVFLRGVFFDLYKIPNLESFRIYIYMKKNWLLLGGDVLSAVFSR